jgi:nucleoside-triphosphatase THEP1
MNIFITGNPGCGKSTLIQKVLEELSDNKVSDIVTPEIRVNGARQDRRELLDCSYFL